MSPVGASVGPNPRWSATRPEAPDEDGLIDGHGAGQSCRVAVENVRRAMVNRAGVILPVCVIPILPVPAPGLRVEAPVYTGGTDDGDGDGDVLVCVRGEGRNRTDRAAGRKGECHEGRARGTERPANANRPGSGSRSVRAHAGRRAA